MKTSLKWICDLVPGLSVTPQEYADAMTLSGSKVEGYECMDEDLDRIVIGQVLSIEKHPDADKLVICQVDVGSDKIQIVTGADNIKAGDKVPVCLDGGKVAGGHDGKKTPGGIPIKKGKLRGVESDGMMCSIEELGSSRDMFSEAPENGIYIFPEDAKVGENAVTALGLDDCVVDYEITSNRVDCFSVLGIAREAAATFDLPFEPPKVTETGNKERISDYISVSVENEDLCSRYTARVIKNIHFAPSPKWMQERLRAHGIRPINNLVDITNYVMVEYGQPMHAYDLDTIAGHKIIVKNAADGETFVTLDGQERKLDKDVLMICDGEKEIGLAGIMGGENSMITENVSNVLFEAACFDGTNIRLSSKRLGMRTDASSIFEKGLDPNNAYDAMMRACQLVEDLGAGEVVGGYVDVYARRRSEVRIPFEPERYNAMLGTDIDAKTMLGYFKKLGLGYDRLLKEVIVPTFRQDLLTYADLAEEVARFFGYDKIPTTLPKGSAGCGGISKKARVERIARRVCQENGFSQAMVYSFESPKVFDKLLMDENAPERSAIKIANPLGEDYSIMRTVSVNGMLTSLATNYSRRNKDVRLYELGNIYLPKQLPLTELPDEREQLTIGFYGEGDFFDLKGVVLEFLEAAGLREKPVFDPEKKQSFLHPGRQAQIRYCDQVIGCLGEVHPSVCDTYDLKTRAYLAVIDLPSVVEKADFGRKYKGIANFPASTRDISMLVPKDIPAAAIEDVFDQKGGAFLESYRLFDIYEGAQVISGYKSIAYSLTFRAPDRSLSDEDVNAAMKRILKALSNLNIELRS